MSQATYFTLTGAQLSALAQANDAAAIAEIARRAQRREQLLAAGKLSYTRAKVGGIADKHPAHARVIAPKAAAPKAAKQPAVVTRAVTKPVAPKAERLTLKSINARVDALAVTLAQNSDILARIAAKLEV